MIAVNNFSANYKKALLVILVGFLFFPYLQNNGNLLPIHKLHGFEGEKKPEASFSFAEWFKGSYQEQKETFLNNSFGLRNIFIRCHNQFEYDAFNKAIANGVVIGKNNYLYESSYIRAYYGEDFIGKDSIAHRMQRLKFIQDTLAKLNKTFILVFAAGKGSFYPEYFPDSMKTRKSTTNYEYHLRLAKELGINYIDFNKYFIDNKEKSRYSLYPQYGIHWSYYGECLASDSIVKYIEKKRNIIMPHFYWDTTYLKYPGDHSGDSYPQDNRDNDVEDGMNLLFNMKEHKMAYPYLQIQSDSGKTKPSSIVIADSYYWGMFNFGISRLFSDSHFWFYNQQVYPDSYTSPLNTDKLNLKDEIASHDVIIIMATEATLPKLGWGFIEDTYNMFHGKSAKTIDTAYERKLNKVRVAIKADPNWLSVVVADARKNNIPLDSAITLNAMWVAEHNKSK